MIDQTAEIVWRIISGNAGESRPSRKEVEAAVQRARDYWTNRDILDKYREEGQWYTPGQYIVPFYGVPLLDYAQDNGRKIADMPIVPLSLPKNRGLAKVTYTSKGRECNIPVMRFGSSDRNGGTLYRQLAGEYFAEWVGDKLFIFTECNSDKPKITTINIYAIAATDQNITKQIEWIVISEVLKIYRYEVPKDFVIDQNPSV